LGKKRNEKDSFTSDKILEISKTFLPSVEFSYNKYYIGLWVDGRACNFAVCRPQKSALRLEIRLPQTEETEEIISSSELDVLDYDKRWRSYRLKLTEKDITEKEETLSSLLKQAYELRK
jgi:predicted transport protein